MKKILFVFPPREKASENYYFRVNQEIKIFKKKFQVKIIDPISKTEVSSLKEPFVYRFLLLIISIPNLVRLIVWADIVILYASPLWYITAPLAKLLGKKIIAEHFTTTIYNYEFSKLKYKKVFFFLDYIAYRLFSLVITHTNSMMNLLVANYKFDKSKILVLYNYTDTRTIKRKPKNSGLLISLGISKFKRIVIYHGFFHPFHGVDVIIKAANLLKRFNIGFLVIGKELSMKNSNIISVKSLKYNELVDYLSLGDLWVGMVGKGVQGNRAMSSSMVTAMSVSLPVVVGDWPENKVIIRDGFNGFLIKRNDPDLLAKKILEVFKLNSFDALGANARKTVKKKFSQEVMGRKAILKVNLL